MLKLTGQVSKNWDVVILYLPCILLYDCYGNNGLIFAQVGTSLFSQQRDVRKPVFLLICLVLFLFSLLRLEVSLVAGSMVPEMRGDSK